MNEPMSSSGDADSEPENKTLSGEASLPLRIVQERPNVCKLRRLDDLGILARVLEGLINLP